MNTNTDTEYFRERAIEFAIISLENEKYTKEQAELARQRAIGEVSYVNMYITIPNGNNGHTNYRKPFIPCTQTLNTDELQVGAA